MYKLAEITISEEEYLKKRDKLPEDLHAKVDSAYKLVKQVQKFHRGDQICMRALILNPSLSLYGLLTSKLYEQLLITYQLNLFSKALYAIPIIHETGAGHYSNNPFAYGDIAISAPPFEQLCEVIKRMLRAAQWPCVAFIVTHPECKELLSNKTQVIDEILSGTHAPKALRDLIIPEGKHLLLSQY